MRKIFLFMICVFLVLNLNINIFADTHKISYQEALNMALENNNSLKELEENMEYLDEQKNKTQNDLSTAINTTESAIGDQASKLAAEYNNIMRLIKTLKKYEDDISDYDLQKKIKSDISELSLRNHLINIKSYELDIDILKKDIDLDKSNLRVSEIKRDCGLISDLDFTEAQNKLTEKNNRLNDYYIKLKNEHQSLNKLLGLDINSENEFELELPKEEFAEDTDIDTHILNQFNNSPALEIQRKKVDEAQYAVDTYDSLLTDSEIRINNDLNDATRAYDDLVKNLQDNIRKEYNNLKYLYENKKILEQDILTACRTYEANSVKYQAGNISLNSLSESEINIDKAKVALEKNDMAISKSIFNLNRSYLMGNTAV